MDLNSNGRTDLLAFAKFLGNEDRPHDKHYVVLSDEDGKLTRVHQKIRYQEDSWAGRFDEVVVKDFNNDGKMDLFFQGKQPEDKHYLIFANDNLKYKNKNAVVYESDFDEGDWNGEASEWVAGKFNTNDEWQILKVPVDAGFQSEDPASQPANAQQKEPLVSPQSSLQSAISLAVSESATTSSTILSTCTGETSLTLKALSPSSGQLEPVVISPICPVYIPGLPESLTVPSTSTTGAFAVYWTPLVSNTPVSYVLEQRLNSGKYIEVYRGTISKKYIAGLVNGTYVFRVKACNFDLSCSLYRYSNAVVVNILTAPPVPTHLSLNVPTLISTHELFQITWSSEPDAEVTAYQLMRTQAGISKVIYQGSSLSYWGGAGADQGNTDESYQLRAQNVSGWGPYTAPVNLHINARPVVTISQPSANHLYQSTENVAIVASAVDPDGDVAEIGYALDGGATLWKTGASTTQYYGILAKGAHKVRVWAKDYHGVSSFKGVDIDFSVNDAPRITGQQTLSTDEETDFTLLPSQFNIVDTDTPATALSLVVLAGSHYRFSGTQITPDANFTGVLSIPLKVSDGIEQGSVYQAQLTVKAINDAPSINAIANKSIAEDGTTGNLAVTIGDVDTAVTTLTLSKASSNTSLIPLNNIILGGSGANRTVKITPAANKSGSATLTLTVSDGSLTATRSFVVTVNAVNDAPSINAIASKSILEDGSTGNLPVTIGDIDTAVTALTLSKASSNTTLIPLNNIVLGGSGANRTVNVTPAANQSGSATISLTVSDGSLTATRSFVVTVAPVNDALVISQILGVNGHVRIYPAGHAKSGQMYTGEYYVPQLRVDATDVEGDGLQYAWSIVSGSEYVESQLSASNQSVFQFRTHYLTPPITTAYITLRVTVTDAGGMSAYRDQTILINNRPDFTLTNHNATGTRGSWLEFPSNASAFSFSGAYTDTETEGLTLFRYLRRYNELSHVWEYWSFNSQSWSLSSIGTEQRQMDYVSGTPTWAISNQFGVNDFPPLSDFNATLYRYFFIVSGHDTDWIFGSKGQWFSINAKPQITGQVPLSVTAGVSLDLKTNQLTISDEDDASGFVLSIAPSSASCPLQNVQVSGLNITPSANFTGQVTIPVVVNDGTEESAVYCLAVDVTVADTNQAPVISGSAAFSVLNNSTLTLSLSNFTVTDDDPNTVLTLTVLAGTNYSLNANTITPSAGFVGELTVPVTVSDGELSSEVFNATVEVNAAIDPNDPAWKSLGSCDPANGLQTQICTDGAACTLNALRQVACPVVEAGCNPND